MKHSGADITNLESSHLLGTEAGHFIVWALVALVNWSALSDWWENAIRKQYKYTVKSTLTKECKGWHGSTESKAVPEFAIVILPTVKRMDLRELGIEPEISVKRVL